METCELEEKIYSALKGNSAVVGNLASGAASIFHYKAPAVYPAFPILVYSVVSDVPALHGDNRENLHRVTIRIHIITNSVETGELYAAVKKTMSELGFTRIQTTPFVDEDETQMLIADFKILIGG